LHLGRTSGVIARSETTKQSRERSAQRLLDCHVASLLAMTITSERSKL